MSPLCRLLAALLATQAVLSAAVYYEGTVVGSMGMPLPGATVAVVGGPSVQTDTNGKFALTAGVLGAPGVVRQHLAPDVDFVGTRIVMRRAGGRRVSASVFDAKGRRRELLRDQIAATDAVSLDITGGCPLAAGVYTLRVAIDGSFYAVKFTMAGRAPLWPSSTLSAVSPTFAFAKKLASNQITASLTGYQAASHTVESDTAVGLLITLYQDGLTVPTAVTAVEGQETKTFKVPTAWNTGYSTWLNGNVSESWQDTKSSVNQSRTYRIVTLDNGIVKVVVAPDLGMRVIRVEDRSGGNAAREMFARFDSPTVDATHIADIGGLKPSFPFYEHGSGMVHDTAGYYVKKDADGSVSVVMNMRLNHDHYNRAIGMGRLGRFSDRQLSGVVTLRPGESLFSVKYMIENHTPLRRSNRLWTVCLFPSGGRKVLFPTKWEISHGALVKNDYETNGLAGNFNYSHFALYPQYPFCGFYYTTDKANHLRVTDPKRYPGMKLYDDNYKIEFWGSTTTLFEAPDTFANAFEPVPMEHKYYMTRSIGPAACANEFVAISVEDKAFQLTGPVPAIVDICDYDGQTPILSAQAIGPNAAAVTGTFQNGLRVVAGGVELCNVRLPLVYEDNGATYDNVKEKSQLSGGLTNGDGTPTSEWIFWWDGAKRKYNYELEENTNKWWMLNSMLVLLTRDKTTSADDPEVLVSMANTAYRHGGFSIVDNYLSKVTGAATRPDARFLTALMTWEKGEPDNADFSNTVIEGNYFTALKGVKAGNTSAAITALDALLAQRPDAVRPRLMRAWLKRDLDDAVHCLVLMPGSVEVWTVLSELGYPGAAANLAGLLRQNELTTIRKDDFVKEVTEGVWRYDRRLEYEQSWFTITVSQPPREQCPDPPDFPAYLKYVY